MAAVDKRTVSLPAELGAYVDHLVAAGAYASVSEVVRAGLRALQERDRVMERWLRDEVVPAALAIQSDPSRGAPAEEVFEALHAGGGARHGP